MNRITTAQEGNAIARIVFVVEFDRPLDSATLKAVDQVYPRFKSELPRRAPGQGFMIHFGGALAVEQPQFPDLSSLVYERLAPDGQPQRGLRLEANSVQVLRADYTRWSEVWPGVRELLKTVLPACLQGRAVAALSIHYIDLFGFNGPASEFRPDMVLNPESPFIPAHVFERKLDWHAYTGWFEEVDLPVPHNVLSNVNVDVLAPPEGDRVLQISLVHTVRFREALNGSDAVLEETNGESALDRFMSAIHNYDKRVLGKVLNSEAQELIGLKP
jgi:uncharacterized protein (TIGR04255 family)